MAEQPEPFQYPEPELQELTEDEKAELEALRRESEEWARNVKFVRQFYTCQDMLIDLEPNEGGFYGSIPYQGGPFDETKFRLVPGGWDHSHCLICGETIEPGDEWWAAEPPNVVGLCLACHARLFGENST